jgi:hypothetical protein
VQRTAGYAKATFKRGEYDKNLQADISPTTVFFSQPEPLYFSQ